MTSWEEFTAREEVRGFSSGYLYVTVLGAVFLKEKIGKRKLCGLGIILAGILIYAL